MRGTGSLIVAALLSAAGVAAAVDAPTTATRPEARVTVAAPQPVLPQLPAGYDAPATLTPAPDSTTPAAPAVVPVVTVDDAVPARALEAYQRAAAVIGQADPSCHLAWPLLAAIGRVESDHGQAGGSQLTPDGKAQPAILGPPLDGGLGMARVVDTDHGSLDGDAGVDRALGPMQFIPSTWAAVAVDADGDGVRDPQDIDDAALGAAVFLCAWHDDLATEAGQRAAVLRYNHSRPYMHVVLETMTRYADAYGTPSAALLLASAEPMTLLPGTGSDVVVDAAPAPEAVPDAGASTWNDVEHPSWDAAPPPPTPTPSAPPVASPAPAVPPATDPSATPSATSSATPSASPTPSPSATTPSAPTTPENPPSSTPTEAPAPTGHPSPSEVPSPSSSPSGPTSTPPSTPSGTPSIEVTFDPTEPPPTGPDSLTPEERDAVDGCATTFAGEPAEASHTAAQRLLTCLAKGLGVAEDDPRLVWIVAQLVGLPPEEVPHAGAS